MSPTLCRLTPICVLGFAWTLLSPSVARAHALKAECRLLGNNRVQVEGWFDNGGPVPHGADVRVYRVNGSLLIQGQLDAQGRYVFSFDSPERLQVTVSDGQGHAAKVWLTEQDLRGAEQADDGLRRSVRSAESPLKDLAAGLALVLAAAAFLLSWRNAQRLRALEQRARVTLATERPPQAAPPTDPDPR